MKIYMAKTYPTELHTSNERPKVSSEEKDTTSL